MLRSVSGRVLGRRGFAAAGLDKLAAERASWTRDARLVGELRSNAAGQATLLSVYQGALYALDKLRVVPSPGLKDFLKAQHEKEAELLKLTDSLVPEGKKSYLTKAYQTLGFALGVEAAMIGDLPILHTLRALKLFGEERLYDQIWEYDLEDSFPELFEAMKSIYEAQKAPKSGDYSTAALVLARTLYASSLIGAELAKKV